MPYTNSRIGIYGGRTMIDNEFYKDLGEKWFSSEGDAVALLRQENQTKMPWVLERFERLPPHAKVLDIGCGGGFLALGLAREGLDVTALDVCEAVMAPGRARNPNVDWVVGQAEALPFPDDTFDAVCMMDVLEHVFDPRQVLSQASRVLKPGGTLLLHTFNRTALSWLFAARGLDWFLRDSQRHVHDWKMFIKPEELGEMLEDVNVSVHDVEGIQPEIFSLSFLKLVFSGRVPQGFGFKIGGGTKVGYLVDARVNGLSNA